MRIDVNSIVSCESNTTYQVTADGEKMEFVSDKRLDLDELVIKIKEKVNNKIILANEYK